MDIDDIEQNISQQYRDKGFEAGFKAGQNDGQKEGSVRGADEGRRIAAAVGFFNGFAKAKLAILEQQQQEQQASLTEQTPNINNNNKITKLYTDIVEIAEQFPRTNATDCEAKMQKLNAKVKQLNSMMEFKSEFIDLTDVVCSVNDCQI